LAEAPSTSDWWTSPKAGEPIRVGDVFYDVPLVSLGRRQAVLVEEEIYLPTTREMGLVVAALPGSYWVVPILTEANFSDVKIFSDLVERARSEQLSGWLLVPSIFGINETSVAALVALSVIPRWSWDEGHTDAIAAMTRSGREVLREALARFVKEIVLS
jgi:hypothetical protein